MVCYLVRHGRDDESRRGGWSDAALCAEGILQVQQLAARLAAEGVKAARIYTSDLPRARQSADILAAALALPVETLAQFRETNNGLLAGMDNTLANERYPNLYWNTLGFDECYPEGESPAQFYARIEAAWAALKARIREDGEDVLLVTHGGVAEAIRCMEAGLPYTNKKAQFPALAYAEMLAIEIV